MSQKPPNHALQRTQPARRCGAVWLEGRCSNERHVARPGPLSLFSLGVSWGGRDGPEVRSEPIDCRRCDFQGVLGGTGRLPAPTAPVLRPSFLQLGDRFRYDAFLSASRFFWSGSARSGHSCGGSFWSKAPNHALQRTQPARRCGAVWLEGRRSNECHVARPGPLSLFSLGLPWGAHS